MIGSASKILSAILLIIIWTTYSCSNNESPDSKNSSDIKLDVSLMPSLVKNDTLVFQNSEFGNDTLIIDSIITFSDNISRTGPYESITIYSDYRCGAKRRKDDAEIMEDISLKNYTPGALISLVLINKRDQVTMINLGESLAINSRIDSINTKKLAPDSRYDYNRVMYSDTALYLNPSPYHINKIYWSTEYGPVGFTTIGNHQWIRY